MLQNNPVSFRSTDRMIEKKSFPGFRLRDIFRAWRAPIYGTIVAIVLTITQTFGQEKIKILLSGNLVDATSQDSLIYFVDQYCLSQQSNILWVQNGDTFKEADSDEVVTTWAKAMVGLLEKFPNLQIIVNQGDRDWNNGDHGWQRIQTLQRLLSQVKPKRLHLFFGDGCPGPWDMSVGDQLQIVVVNSEWFNRKFDKPLPSMNVCNADINLFIEDVREIMEENSGKNILLLSHYPILGAGNYSGRFPTKSYLVPPIIGAARVAFHQQVGNAKDLSNENFTEFRSKVENLLEEFQGIIVASAHEQNHSVIIDGSSAHVNSGAPMKGTYVRSNLPLASTEPGMIEMTYQASGEVTYRFVPLHGVPHPETRLWQSPCDTENKGPSNPRVDPCKPSAMKDSSRHQKKIFTTIPAGPEYTAGPFKQVWVGRHYRFSWTTPIEVRYLDMDTTYGGLHVIGRGGGRQTTSLKFKAANGKEYVYRSVDKDPAKALAFSLRGTIVSDIVKDQTTTQQPFGALAASSLLDETAILHASPQLYIVPSTPELGAYQDEFEDLMGFLEERPTDKISKEDIFAKADHIEKSHDLFSKLYADHDKRVDAHEFARSRVFDILVGDWGKHEDNWKWAGFKTDGGEIFKPIPRDRDHVFSRWDGVLPFLADRAWAKPSGENFDYKIKGLRSLMWQARHLDRQLANSLTREDWIEAAHQIQNAISEEDIERAVAKMPREIYSTDGKAIEAKLKARRRDLQLYAERYYQMLSPQVDVVGSNKREFFNVHRDPDGSVTVDMYDLDPSTQQPVKDRHYYSRKFYPHQTKEIRLYGLMGDDVFQVTGHATKSILVRIISGNGSDIVNDESEASGKQTRIYEQDDKSLISLGETSKRVTPKTKELYDYNRTAFAYNTYFPLAYVSYSPFTGLALQSGVSFTRHNFDKPGFSARHSINGSISLQKNYELEYDNQLRHVIGKWDFVSRISISRPLNYNYFFGIGNNTKNNNEFGSTYYRSQYNQFGVKVGLVRTFWKRSSLHVGVSFETADGVERESSFLNDHPGIFGTDLVHQYALETGLDIDLRNAAMLPERGFRFFVSNSTSHIPQATSILSSVSQFGLEQYLSTYNANPITFGIRAGGGTTSGQLPFYKLLSIGQLNDLRGFKRNRFTGERKGYVNTEIRWQILERRNAYIPFKLGLSSFFDVARVWSDDDSESDNFYHVGYGAGLYVIPFQAIAISVSAGFSKEEPLLFMFGVGTNALR